MQVTNRATTLPTYGVQTQKLPSSDFSLNILQQLPKNLQEAFNDATVGLDEDLRNKRAISFSFNMQNPIFSTFKDGEYPAQMPSDVRSALESQKSEYSQLGTEKERYAYKISYMLEHLVFKRSSDPEAEGFYKEVYKNYTGVSYAQDNSRDAINDRDTALQQFKKDLTTKGAAKYLHDFNQEKIDALVEKFRDNLLKELQKNPDASMDVEKLVNDYRKELIKKLEELEKDKKKSPLNIETMKSDLLQTMSTKLEDVLQL